MSIVVDKKSRTKNGDFHFHSTYEIIIVSSGNAEIRSLEDSNWLSQGDAVIIPPKFTHKINPLTNNFSYYYIFGISDTYLNTDEPIVIKNDLILDSTVLAELIYNNRYSQNEEYFLQLVNSLISLLTANVNVLNDMDLAVNKIIRSVHREFSNPKLSVCAMLRESGYAEDYMRAHFKKVTGKTPNEFLTELRITHAKKLMGALKDTVSLFSIAESCGYDDYPYFSRKFKEITGVSPQKFKKSQKY